MKFDKISMEIYKFFDKSSKKRDLSDKSSNGEDPKKQREGSLDDVIFWYFVYESGIYLNFMTRLFLQ